MSTCVYYKNPETPAEEQAAGAVQREFLRSDEAIAKVLEGFHPDDLAERGFLAGVPVSRLYPDHDDLSNLMLVAATETNTIAEMDALANALSKALA